MNRRGLHRRNDGIPISNGKKVQRHRRQKFGLEQSSSSKKSSFCRPIIYCIALVVTVAFLIRHEKGQAIIAKNWNVKQVTEIISSKKETKRSFRMPNKCTDAQLSIAKKQLPEDYRGRPWHSGITLATVRSKFAYNPKLMREFYASDDFNFNTKTHSFYAVFIRWKKNFAPIDSLAIGSRNSKFNTDQWKSELGLDENNALSPVAIDYAAGTRPAKALVVEYEAQTPIPLESLKTKFGYSDNELAIVKIQKKQLNDDVMSKIVSRQKPSTTGKVDPTQPIHFLDISGTNGEDADILLNLMSIMDQVRYLHFEYNYPNTSWSNVKLSSLVKALQAKGLVCYFAGNKETDYALWRITDCFLDYYDIRRWAWLDCVNVEHEDVSKLASRMEQEFLMTLQTGISYFG